MGAKIVGRPSKYMKDLKENPNWEEAKRKIRMRDNYACQNCGTKKDLETHHITYKVGNVNIFHKELDYLECLVLVCGACHTLIHGNYEHKWNPFNKNKEFIKC